MKKSLFVTLMLLFVVCSVWAQEQYVFGNIGYHSMSISDGYSNGSSLSFNGSHVGIGYNGYLLNTGIVSFGIGAGISYLYASSDKIDGVWLTLSKASLSLSPSCRFGSSDKYMEASLKLSIPLASNAYIKSTYESVRIETDPKTGFAFLLEGRYGYIGAGLQIPINDSDVISAISIGAFLQVYQNIEVIPTFGYIFYRSNSKEFIFALGVHYLL